MSKNERESTTTPDNLEKSLVNLCCLDNAIYKALATRLLNTQKSGPPNKTGGIAAFVNYSNRVPELADELRVATDNFGVGFSNRDIYPLLEKMRGLLGLKEKENLDRSDPRVLAFLDEVKKIFGLDRIISEDDIEELTMASRIIDSARSHANKAIKETLKKGPLNERSALEALIKNIFGSESIPSNAEIDVVGTDRDDLLKYFNEILDKAGINQPLFPTAKGKERIPFRIATELLSFEEYIEQYEKRAKAKEFILRSIAELYEEAIGENPSTLSLMVKFYLEYNLPENYPLPIIPPQNKGRRPIGLYRSDIVLTQDSESGQIKFMVVEDDASPGGLGISTALLQPFNKDGPLHKLAQAIINEASIPHRLTILRSGRVFPRPEHQMIKTILEDQGVEVNIVDIEEVTDISQVPDGWVFFYGLAAHIFPTKEAFQYELLSSPKRINDLLKLNLSQDRIAQIEQEIKKKEESDLRSFKNFLSPFTNSAIDHMLSSIYNFTEQEKERLCQVIDQEYTKRIKIAQSLHERDSDPSSKTKFINPLWALRLTHTKIADVIPFLPGFKEYLIQKAEQEGFYLEAITAFYETTPFGFLAINGRSGIKELDEFINQCLRDLQQNPDGWVAKASDCPLGLVNWGSRSLVGGITKNHKLNSLTLLEKIFSSPIQFIFQRCINSRTENDKNLGYYFTNYVIIRPKDIVLRISPYVVYSNISNGLYTGETVTSNTQELSAHGGTSSFFGPLNL